MAPLIRRTVRQEIKTVNARIARLERRGRIRAAIAAAVAGLIALIAKWKIES